jgi:hypothetical protein
VDLPKRTFKRLIADPKSGKFLAPDGQWMTDEAEGMHFYSLSAAISACAKHRVLDAEVVLRFSGGQTFDVRVPVRHDAWSYSAGSNPLTARPQA